MKYENSDYNNYDIADVADEYLDIEHQKTWNALFGNSQVEFRAYFPVGSFDEHRETPKHLQDLGLRLVQLYRSQFEDEAGYTFSDETTAPRSIRACDIQTSTMQAYFESLRNDVVQS